MFKIKGYIFHHDENDNVIPIDISTVPGCEELIATGYEDAYSQFEGIKHYLFLLSPIKEKVKEE